MARNRKKHTAGIRFGPALKAFVLCVLIGGAGVGYVWQKQQISRLGVQIRERERLLNGLTEQNENRGKQLADMLTTQFLEARIKELRLGLVRPDPSQIWTLPEPLPGEQGLPRESQFAARSQGLADTYRQ
jgi:hypothetical protein